LHEPEFSDETKFHPRLSFETGDFKDRVVAPVEMMQISNEKRRQAPTRIDCWRCFLLYVFFGKKKKHREQMKKDAQSAPASRCVLARSYLAVEHGIGLIEEPLSAGMVRDRDALKAGVRLVDGGSTVLLLQVLAVGGRSRK